MNFRLNFADLGYRGMGCRRWAMPQRTFGDGYLAGWRWVRGSDEAPAIPDYSPLEGEAPFRAGVTRGVRDGCASPQKPVTKCDQIKNWLGRALQEGHVPVR